MKKISSLHIHTLVFRLGRFRGRPFGLTLGFPEDPRAHELEEATGVEAGPVDGDGVLRTDGRTGGTLGRRGTVRKPRARQGRRSTYPVVHQGLPRVLQLLDEPGRSRAQEEALSRICFPCSTFQVDKWQKKVLRNVLYSGNGQDEQRQVGPIFFFFFYLVELAWC